MRYRLNFWKPNKGGNGAAALFEFNADRGGGNNGVFFTMIPQSGESLRSFDSSRRLRPMKLGLNDIGEILTVLLGIQEGLGKLDAESGRYSGLFHNTPGGGNSVFSLSYNPDRNSYWIGSSIQGGEGEGRYMVGMTLGEAQQLRVFLESALRVLMEDSFVPGGGDDAQQPGGDVQEEDQAPARSAPRANNGPRAGGNRSRSRQATATVPDDAVGEMPF
jgi:hypothetical protein